MKAYKVSDGDEYGDELGCIVFHETANKARYFALMTYDGFDFSYAEYRNLTAKRVPEVDHLATAEPSILDWCKNSDTFESLGWFCRSEGDCDDRDCAFKRRTAAENEKEDAT